MGHYVGKIPHGHHSRIRSVPSKKGGAKKETLLYIATPSGGPPGGLEAGRTRKRRGNGGLAMVH